MLNEVFLKKKAEEEQHLKNIWTTSSRQVLILVVAQKV
jgi:hypothetical protein